MIRHRPGGSGHPYDTTADQRVPVRPLDGDTVELRVLAAEGVTEVTCEWDDGKQPITFPLTPTATRRAAVAGAEGHLTAAAARTSGGRPWSAVSPPIAVERPVRYRFLARTAERSRTSRWYPVAASTWSASGGRLITKGTSRLVPGSVTWLADLTGTHRVRFALRLAPEEHLLGFGERYDALDQRGLRLDATVFEQYKGQAAARRTYLPMPFAHVLGGAGWAFHVETAERTWYDSSAGDRLWIEADLAGRPTEELGVRFLDGDPGRVLHEWLVSVGAPTELPEWVFGLWGSGNEWNTQAAVTAQVERHRDEDVPIDVVVIEAWSDESTFTAFRDAKYDVSPDGSPHRLADFTFPPDGAWPDPKGMVDRLHEQDVRVVLWQIPLQKMRPAPTGQARADAEALVRLGHAVTEREGARPYRNRGWWFPTALMPDLSSAPARAWWLAKRRYLVEEIGIDGFKTDGGEHAWGDDLRYADGFGGVAGNNRFPVHYAAAYADLLRSCGKAPVTFSRAGFTGSQAHGAFWAGDEDSTWEAMRGSLIAGLTAAACGIVYWGWDLAGFSGPVPDAELYLRAAAVSTFVPIMQYHSEFNHHRKPPRDRTPWNVAELTGDDRVLPTFRAFAHLRRRLRPYLVEQARQTLKTGWPLMRTPALVHPDDPRTWAHPYQFLLGDDLLVAPVVEPGVTSATTYLPEGRWVEVWSSRIHRGGREVQTEAPLDRIPVWCRQGRWTELRATFASG